MTTRLHRASLVQKFLQQNNVDHLDWPAQSPDLSPIEHVWDILGQHVRQSSTTKNAPSVGHSLAGVEDTPATDCQTRQEYASSLCGLHRCNRWTYAILTDLWGFIGDPSDLPLKFSFTSSATDTNGWIFVCKWNDVIKYINFRFQICLSFLLFHRTYKYPFYFTVHPSIHNFFATYIYIYIYINVRTYNVRT